MKHVAKIHKAHIAALLIIGVFVVWTGFSLVSSPFRSSKEVVVKEGQSVGAIAEILEKNGIIQNKFVFVAYVLVTGNEKKLQAGRYLFKPGTTVPGIVYSMANGFAESDDIVVTIPEGFNVWEIDERLTAVGLISEGEFVKKYHTQEGQFFPDTYRFSRETCNAKRVTGDEKREACVDEVAEKMKNHLNLKFKNLSIVLSSLVLRDTLIKASILEKETRKEEDMRLVAGVIENRLARRMFLQIDATVSYGVCLRNIEILNIKYCDVAQVGVANEIKIDGPYNTYTRKGLPPGPIANPGIRAIQAALNPAESDYLYYLSTRDGSQIVFSKTAAEHTANKKKYLGI